MKNYNLKFTPKESQPGYWGTVDCDLFDGEEKIFSFNRKYGNFHEETTKFFQLNGKDYLVFSADYEIPSFYNITDRKEVKLTDESQKQIHGFCPVEIYIPKYKLLNHEYEHNGIKNSIAIYYNVNEGLDFKVNPECEGEEFLYHDFCFLAGCVWGDDSSWKLNLLDLKDLDKGELWYRESLKQQENKWLYERLPNLPLDKCIEIDYDGDEIPLNRKDLRIRYTKSVKL